MIAEAGTYDYWLLPEAGRAYVMAAGAKPELVADTWGLVGNIAGWGDLGDFSMSEEGAYLVRKGVALTTASEFKIRLITPGTTPRTTARRRAVRSTSTRP